MKQLQLNPQLYRLSDQLRNQLDDQLRNKLSFQLDVWVSDQLDWQIICRVMDRLEKELE